MPTTLRPVYTARIIKASALLGWWVYATNRPVVDLDTTQIVLAHRDQYSIWSSTRSGG